MENKTVTQLDNESGHSYCGWIGHPLLRKHTKGGLAAAPRFGFLTWKVVLDRLDVLGLPALRALDNVELHLLTFLEAAESGCLDGGEVHKHILTVLAADESITLRVVKPLYCSCFHGVALFLLL